MTNLRGKFIQILFNLLKTSVMKKNLHSIVCCTSCFFNP